MSFQVDGRGKVTAGIPGLSPEKRGRADYFWQKRDRLQTLCADVEGRRRAAASPDGDRPTHLKEAQKGIELHSTVIIQRLLKLNPSLIFERSLADKSKTGIYHIAEGEKRFIVGMESEMNPEFETKPLDSKGECKTTLRGWRTVLARLIRNRFITPTGTAAMFGSPSKSSKNWQVFTT